MTDQFSYVGYGPPYTAEIGQPTFVEVISATKSLVSPAIRRSSKPVELSLAQLAFGRRQRPSWHQPGIVHQITATPQHTVVLDSGNSQTTEESAQALKAAKVNAAFYKLTQNDIEAQDYGCGTGENLAVNGFFTDGIDGWFGFVTGFSTQATLGYSHDILLGGALVIPPDCEATQNRTTLNLVPGSELKITLRARIPASPSGSPTGLAYVGIRYGSPPAPGNLIAHEIPVGGDASNFVIWSTIVTVPANGSVTVVIANGSDGNLHIDQVEVCATRLGGLCGWGYAQATRNGNFYSNTIHWYTDSALTTPFPLDDPLYWTSSKRSNTCIILDGLNDGATEMWQDCEGLNPGDNLYLDYGVVEKYQFNSPLCQIQIGITDGADPNTVLNSITLTHGTLGVPHRGELEFTVPASGSILVFARLIAPYGIFYLSGFHVCVPSECGGPYTLISRDNFTNNQGGWSGGILEDDHIALNIDNRGIVQVFEGLAPGSRFRVRVRIGISDIVQIQLQSGGNTIGHLASAFGTFPYHFTSIIVAEDGRVVVSMFVFGGTVIRPPEFPPDVPHWDATIDEIATCGRLAIDPPEECDGSINSLRVGIEWNGVPRTVMNVFTALAKYTIRDPDNPASLTRYVHIASSEGHTATPLPISCLSVGTCDFWKQQGDDGQLETGITGSHITQSEANAVVADTIVSISNRDNWLWSIPASQGSDQSDRLTVTFPPSPPGLVESVEFFLLMNVIDPFPDTGTPPNCTGPYLCGTDPATSFDVIIDYNNNIGQHREFRMEKSINSILHQNANYDDLYPFTWDSLTAAGNGLKGTSARWLSTRFLLNSIGGTGLDQCGTGTGQQVGSTGQWRLKKMTMSGAGHFLGECTPVVTIEEVVKGVVVNSRQSIELPTPTAGTWTLTIELDGDLYTTDPISWDATATEVQNALGALLSDPNDVEVTGTGISGTPFIVEFVGNLAGIPIPLMEADGSDLEGSSVAYTTTITNGSLNERQVVFNSTGGNAGFRLAFGHSLPQYHITNVLEYDTSLDVMQSELNGNPDINGGVTVTGNIADRTLPYTGPWYVDFGGQLAGLNVMQMVAIDPFINEYSTSYVVQTLTQGGVGVNERQRIIIEANSGTFTLLLTEPVEDPDTAITDPIPYNATESVVANAIIAAASWLNSGNLEVVKLADNPNTPLIHMWDLIFFGNLASTDIPLTRIESNGLSGSGIIVTNLATGSGTDEIDRLIVSGANSGYYTLEITIDGVTETSGHISHRASNSDLRTILENMDIIGAGHVTVTTAEVPDPNTTMAYGLVFPKRFGDVLITPIYLDTLNCEPLILPHVPPGPYQYQLPNCDELEDLSCQSGPLLCRPGPGDGVDVIDSCCVDDIRDSANVANQILLQRDLFDPNRTVNGRLLTVRDLANLSGLNPVEYVPYARDFETQTLSPLAYATQVQTKMSIIFIDATINSESTRSGIMNHITTHREVLPARMFWPRNGFVTV